MASQGKRVLIVEGVDDEHVAKHICGTRHLGKFDEISPSGGIDKLLEGVGPRLKESDLSALGIIFDADEDLQGRWDSISSRLRAGGATSVPAEPHPDGTLITVDVPGREIHVGVWIMPDNASNGTLEDFLTLLVPTGNSLLEYAHATIQGIPPESRTFSDLHGSKALIHTWLAWQETPGLPFGTAITARYLDPSATGANKFAQWLGRLLT